LAALKQREGDSAGAIQVYKRAHDLGTLPDRARAQYARLLGRKSRSAEAEELLREGLDDIEAVSSRRALVELLSLSGRQEEGIQLLRKAAEDHNDWQSWADLGSFVLARTENDTDASEALAKAIELGADEPEVFSSLARAIHRSGASSERVAEIASDLTRRFPELQEAWQEAGAIYIIIGAFDEAEASLRKAIDIEGGAFAWLNFGAFLQGQPKRIAEAEAALRQAVALSDQKRFCTPARFLADLLVHKGEDEEARGVIGALLEKNARCYCCTVIQGDIAARGGNLDVARKAFREALAIDENGIDALTGLSRIVDRKEGEALIQRALAANPEDHRVLLARAYLHQNDLESQIEDATEAVRLERAFAEAHLFLCQVLLKQGRMEEALAHLDDALKELPRRRELTPAFVDAAMALAGSGQSEQVSAMLAKDEYGSTMEPLIVTLKLKRGESPIVAKEVLEVAFDIAAGSENTPKS
jgi:tetratricopeptide (TPR) repeat protein